MALTLSAVLTQTHAQENKPLLDRNQFSIGVGISDNEISSPDEDDTGFQFFGAYDLIQVNLMDGVNSSVEFGFMDFGFDEDDTGIWASYVIDGTISGRLGWLAQAGFDIGDDSGFLFGAGLKVMLNDKSDLRFEYVMRDEVDSLQVNFLYHL
ncbi:MAG: porin family protein [Gammaproteobacteria bacterium]|nr:porin family protein [Gammaproteobacteria bacterium]